MSTTLASLPLDARLLLLAAGPAGNDASIAALLGGTIDWDRLIDLAVGERAVAGVWARLAPQGAEVPAPARSHLTQVAMVTEFRQAHLEQQLGEVLGRLADAGIRAVLLKGAALAATVYRSFAERPMNDLDLLIEPGRATEAHALLLAAGWERMPLGAEDEAAAERNQEFYDGHHHLWPLIGPKRPGVRVEIHTELSADGQPFAFTASNVWRDARAITLGGVETYVPSAPHLLLHLCVHFAWSHTMTGAWRTFRDLQVLVEAGAIDWPAFVVLARESRAGTCAYWTLRLARSLARVEVPGAALEALRPRLPEPLLARLELHFAYEMLAPAPLCPSVRVRHALWSLAIQPRRSGHGPARPWRHAGEAPSFAPPEEKEAGTRKIGAHLRRRAEWTRFLRTFVVLPADPA